MLTSLQTSHRAAPARPLSAPLAALVAAAAPTATTEGATLLAARLGCLPVPNTGRAILSGPPASGGRLRHPQAFSPLRPVERGGIRLLDLTV
jgi:hypothetical protein